MTDPHAPRPRPLAFRLGEARAEPSAAVRPDAAVPPSAMPPAAVTVTPQADPYAREAAAAILPPEEAAVETAQAEGMRRRLRLTWGGLFWSALGALVSLGVGLWVSRLVEDLFGRWVALGWVGVALAGIMVLALLALGLREVAGVWRQGRIAALHAGLARARLDDDRDAARAHLATLASLYADRPERAAARAEIARATREIVDGRDLCDIAERALMHPIDRAVRREIAEAAKRVSVVTAISPRAGIDVIFVVAQLVRLIRRIAELYSGRPGLFGFLKLARSVGAHLAVTGGMAVGDSLVQQVLGHGIAAKLSARLGEGVLNGLLTTRVGLSAMAVCRPMPFGIDRPPGVRDVAPFLFGEGREPS